MDLLPDTTPLPPDVDPSADGQDLSPPRPRRRRGAQPRNADDLRRDLYAALQGQADPSGSSALAGDTLREAITHLRAVIDQLDHLSQPAESLDDKIKLFSALGLLLSVSPPFCAPKKSSPRNPPTKLRKPLMKPSKKPIKNGAASNHRILNTGH